MTEANEIIKQAEEQLEDTKTTETLAKVLLIKKKIEDKPIDDWTLDGLVDHVFTLAKIMDNLSEIKDYSRLVMEATEEEYKSAVRDVYLANKMGEEKMTDGVARALAEQACEDIKQKEMSSAHQYYVLNDLYKDCERLISFTQSKIRTMTDNKIRTNFNGI